MFTGLVETMGKLVDRVVDGPGVRFSIDAAEIAADAALGDSVAINGCCLTVVHRDGSILGFDAGEETLSRTNLGELSVGDNVNLERSLQVGQRLGGHYVTGHIDAVGQVDRRQDDADWSTIWFRVPSRLTRQMASKGSVAVDGISLTLVEVGSDTFSVALIPHTLQVTTLGASVVGTKVNIETDILAKYVERQLAGDSAVAPPPLPGTPS